MMRASRPFLFVRVYSETAAPSRVFPKSDRRIPGAAFIRVDPAIRRSAASRTLRIVRAFERSVQAAAGDVTLSERTNHGQFRIEQRHVWIDRRQPRLLSRS